MAVLSDSARSRICQQYAEEVSSERGSLGNLTKAQLRAAFDAMDSWVDSNAASLNAAIPLPARTALTAAQKAKILVYVVEKRFRENT